ncbi:hypothetical protein [uncultured Rhodoblastus sp.]|uniref:hypothetical protein n=1 Tax=uncultured Rhodoblastus sp. TaxID=543037 RepID=UPI0025EBC48C|nr:hypothetical protein [uncultured Rhodoblastus sp.]
MSDAVHPPTVWLDLPRAEAGLSLPEPIQPDIHAALERFAETIAAVKASQVPSIASYFSVDPGRARFNNIARRLPNASLTALLRRMTAGGRAPSAAALPDPAIAALARKSLLSRILDRARIEALQHACEAVSTAPIKQGPFR